RLEQRLSERPTFAFAPEAGTLASAVAAQAAPAKQEGAATAPGPAGAPAAAALGPGRVSPAGGAGGGELGLTATVPPAPRGLAPARFSFDSADGFAPILEPEEDLCGLDQPEPPADAEVGPGLSTREVIEQARAAARAAAPPDRSERMSVKAKASWKAGK